MLPETLISLTLLSMEIWLEEMVERFIEGTKIALCISKTIFSLDDGGAINNDRVNRQTRIYLNTFEKNRASDQGGALRSNGGFFSSRQKNSTA